MGPLSVTILICLVAYASDNSDTLEGPFAAAQLVANPAFGEFRVGDTVHLRKPDTLSEPLLDPPSVMNAHYPN